MTEIVRRTETGFEVLDRDAVVLIETIAQDVCRWMLEDLVRQLQPMLADLDRAIDALGEDVVARTAPLLAVRQRLAEVNHVVRDPQTGDIVRTEVYR